MRVVIVCPYSLQRPGGVQSHVEGLRNALVERGHEAAIVAPRRTIPIPINGSVAPIAFGPGTVLQVRKELARLAPDVVHAHEPLVPGASLFASLGPVPIVGTFHASADKSLGYRVGRPILDRAMKRLGVRTAVSEAARDLISAYWPGEYVLTPNGVDSEGFENAEEYPLPDGTNLLFFGRLERRKGLEVLLQAMTRMRGEARLVVAGDGPERRASESLARELEVEALFLGRVTEREKAGLFRACDLYCSPALGGESFGIVLLEAMAAGAPIVCSDIPGFRAVTGEAAARVPPNNASALAAAIRETLADPESTAVRTKAGRLIARSFDWKRLIVNVESIYERAVSR